MTRKTRRSRREAAGQPQLLRKTAKGRTYQVANFGGRQRSYGRWGDPDGIADFRDDLSAWLETGEPVPNEPAAPPPAVLTIAELAERYKASVRAEHAYDWFARNEPRIRYACDVLVELFGTEPAAAFGPKKLKAVQTHLVGIRKADGVTPRLAIKSLNERVRTIVNVFGWAAIEELVPGDLPGALREVSRKGVNRGRPGTRSSRVVAPVPWAHVEPVLPYLNRPVRALVELLWWTGARPSELFTLRPRDLDRSSTPWTTELGNHKTAHRGKRRTIAFDSEARRVLDPFLLRPANRPLFSPAEGATDTAQRRREGRTTPLWKSHAARYAREKAKRSRQEFGATYDARSLYKALRRAQTRCNAERRSKGLDPIPAWFPYQLRHSAATRIRKAHGIETARVLLGHSSAGMTEVYAEADLAGALAKLG